MLYAHMYIKVINLCIQHWSWLALGGYGFMQFISYVRSLVIQIIIIIIIPFQKLTQKGAITCAFSCYFWIMWKTNLRLT
jgi:heme exporter protein D